MGASQSLSQKSIFEFTVKDAKGKDVNLSIYKGKVLLIVNVASKCGFTNSNYTQLTELYNRYKDKGLEILAFPCNQFLNQEPESSQDVEQFACTRFKAEYPIFGKFLKQAATITTVEIDGEVSILSSLTTLSPYGTKDLKEFVMEIIDDFETASNHGKRGCVSS